jgi:oxygen-dependent protoporphyrinogen oxidase
MGAIVVIGGGIAGLTCAFRLQQAGHDVEVLEREPSAGGRMRSERHGEFVVERGAQFIASGYRNLHHLAAVLGIDDRIRPVARAHNAVLRAGRLEPGDWGSPLRLLGSRLLSFSAKARLPRILIELRANRRLLDPYRPELAAQIDREDMPTYLRRTVGEDALEYLFAPAFSSTFDCEPEDLSGVFVLLALRLLAHGFQLQCFEGGNGLMTRTLAQRVAVRTGAQVLCVETESDGAKVRYRSSSGERSVLADAAVVAVPGSFVTQICHKLTPAERAFFDDVHYVRGAIAHLLLDRAPAVLTDYGVSFPRREGIELYGLAADHYKEGVAPPGAGLVNAALTERAAARLWEAPDTAVVEHLLDELARTPIGRLAPRNAVVHRWDAMLPQFRVGYTARLAAFLSRTDRSPRLAFAGDYLVGPYTEAALTSGMRAATEIARALDKR